jgi:hypothetical protein
VRLDHLLSKYFASTKIFRPAVLAAGLGYLFFSPKANAPAAEDINGSVSPARFINLSKGLPIYCVKCKVKGVMNQGITRYTPNLHLNSGP